MKNNFIYKIEKTNKAWHEISREKNICKNNIDQKIHGLACHGMALIQLQPHVNCHRKFHRVLHLYMVFFSTLKIHATRAQFWILSATGWCSTLVVISICFFFFFFIIIWPRKRKISIFGHQSLHSFSDWVSHARRRRIVTITVVVVVVVNVTTIAAATAITHFTCVFAFVFVQRGIDRWKVGKKRRKKTNSKKFVCSIHVWDAKLSEMNALQMLVKSNVSRIRMYARTNTLGRAQHFKHIDELDNVLFFYFRFGCVCAHAREGVKEMDSSSFFLFFFQRKKIYIE